jgi:hypothetical protein
MYVHLTDRCHFLTSLISTHYLSIYSLLDSPIVLPLFRVRPKSALLRRHQAETGKVVLAMAIKFIHHKGADNKSKL